MALAYSRLTSQGQISVPAEIRRKLGIGPGSILESARKAGHVPLGIFERARARVEGAHRL